MKRYKLLSTVLLFVFAGCVSGERLTLQDIKPGRLYKTTVPVFFDQVRLFSIQENFRLERFEQESGSIIGHKNLTVSRSETGMLGGTTSTKRILMVLKVRPKSEHETTVVASFVFGDEQIVLTRSDEEELVSCYNAFFRHLDTELGPGQVI
jgi:hypothetical protein